MREECKHFQSRTYASGEVARFCVLDLAPEAPWRCPENCPRYERRLADVAWTHTNLVDEPVEDEPNVPPGESVEVLQWAERIVSAVSADAVAEARKRDAEAAKAGRRRRFPWRRR
jgi:hypothetical protein